MKNVAVMMLALASLLALSSPAEAGGGGGAKKNAKIRITNQDTVAVGIILNSPASVTGWVSQAAVIAKGGVVIQPGQTATFSVIAGTNHIDGFDPSEAAPTKVVGGTVTVQKNQTLSLNVDRNGVIP
jgi:hypothetical protein